MTKKDHDVARHMSMVAASPPGASARRWRCTDCGREGTLREMVDEACPKARVGDLTPAQQLQAWVDGRSVCPSTTGECCPDFSCCQPGMLWPEAKRREFQATDQVGRERMMLGAVGEAAEVAGKTVYITRGEPGGRE